MSQVFWIDLPRAEAQPGDDAPFEHVITLHTREEAHKYCLDAWGMPPEIADFFISYGEDDELDG